MCLSKHAVPDNFKTTKDDCARLLTENITAHVPFTAEARAWKLWERKKKSPRERHMKRGEAMTRRAARWNWLAKLDPDLTMYVVIMLFGAAWVLCAVGER